MPFDFEHATTCPACPYGKCFEDRRVDRVRNRNTKFRLNQRVMLQCTFDAFMPGIETDPSPTRRYDEYLDKLTANAVAAGQFAFGSDFKVSDSAIAKVEGDAFELLEAGAFWAAAAAWNEFMQTGVWSSTVFTQPLARSPRRDA